MKSKIIIVALTLFLICIVGNVYAQTATASGGIFISKGNDTLFVKFKPSVDITGAFTGGNFGIRWLTSLGASLSGETGNFGYVNQGAVATSGAYSYIVYASGNNVASTTYTAGTEYTLMSVKISGYTGKGVFELCPSGFASDAGIWYIELNGKDATPAPANWYYQSATAVIPAAPVLQTPASGATGQALLPTLTWGAVTGAVTYRAQVATDSLFASLVVNDSTLTTNSKVLVTSLLNNTKYLLESKRNECCWNEQLLYSI